MLKIGKSIPSFLMLSIIGGFGYLVLNMYYSNLANLSQTNLYDLADNRNNGKNDALKTMIKPSAKTKWQKVQGMKVHQVFVYSAYHDVRSGLTPVIRVIGVTRTKKPENLLCRMYFEEDDDQTFPLTSKDSNGIPDELQTKVNFYRDIPGKITIIWGHHHKEYSACFILCPLTSLYNSSMKNKITAPTFVSVIPESTNKTRISNILRVMNFEAETDGFHEETKRNLGVCIKPIRSNYNQTINLIEFIEFNKILGASKFFFYNLTMSHEIDCILNFYKHKENSVQVMDWDLPRKEPNLDLHDTGGLAARNDCVYRNMYNFKYLMMTDLDEYIVPKQHKDIIEMLEDLSKTNRNGNSMVAVSNSSAITSYNFKNAFFYLHYEDEIHRKRSVNLEDLKMSRVLTKIRRRKKLNPHGERSKYICIPQQVKEAGTHIVYEYLKGYNLNVPQDVALSHHYRQCEMNKVGMGDCMKDPTEVDRTVYKYKNAIMRSIKNVYPQIVSQCKLAPII